MLYFLLVYSFCFIGIDIFVLFMLVDKVFFVFIMGFDVLDVILVYVFGFDRGVCGGINKNF